MARPTRKPPKRSTPRASRALPLVQPVAWPGKFLALWRGGRRVGSVLAIGLALTTALVLWVLANNQLSPEVSIEPLAGTFVGSETCAGCHRSETELWHRSQHKHAMSHATENSVLGDFSNATFDYFGVRSRFYRKDGRFFVETDGADGKLAEFEIKYTFGVEPLQQYLIAFADGRLQALSIAWDTRPKEKGGQRWFHLYPNEPIKHDDVLHWTKLNQNWNFMCSECHSTGVQKNYDAAHDRYSTSWSEISVGCEGCHGKGSRHVAWARDQRSWHLFGRREDPTKGLVVRFDERANVAWPQNLATGEPQRNVQPALIRKEVETCGLCHARRSAFSGHWMPGRWLSNTHRVATMDSSLVYADGQMRDGEESYNYGPFKQSKMFAAGVTCSDCHDPHSATLRTQGDALCTQCHAPEKYETAAHHHHAGVNPKVGCPSCHMPLRTYMIVDRRHDHSFRVPRPDLSLKFATPNACNDCHQDKSAQWAAATIENWFGPERHGFQSYTEAFHAAWSDQSDADKLLAKVAAGRDNPAYARASALTTLGERAGQVNVPLARAALADPDPMVRIGALDMLETLPPQQTWPIASPLLADPILGVRIRAVSLLASMGASSLPADERRRFDGVAAEFVAAQRFNDDRPEARTTLANFFARRGQPQEAEEEYQAALRLSPQYAPAYVNLADLYRHTHRDADAEKMLRRAVEIVPGDAGVHHALGLTLVRLKRLEEALGELRQAATLEPGNARYAYVYGVALHASGRKDEALAVLKDSVARHPNDRDALLALVNFNRDAGNLAAALDYAKQLARLAPSDPNIARFVDDLQRQASKPGAQ
jgi:predicted CXXCH cytochrome family protein